MPRTRQPGLARSALRPRRVRERALGPRFRWLFPLVVLMFGLWLLLPVPALTATIPASDRPAAQPGLPWLSVSGQRIVDDRGRTVLLRGFNSDVLLESTVAPTPLDATDARLMQESGFDVVRLPIAWSLLEPQRGTFSTEYLDRIASTVAMLNQHGLYVVLDMHSLGWSPAYGGSGAPAWATLHGVPDPVWGPMPSALRLLSPAINASTAYFWVTSDWQTQYFATWRFVARRFRDDSGVAGYDIINEPHSFPLPPLRFDKDQLFPFYRTAIEQLGATDPNHLFFLDNDMAGDLPTWVVPLHAPNLVYAPHVYTGSLIPPAFDGNGSSLQTHVAELAREAAQVPAALWFGEFSIDMHSAHAVQWVTDILDDFAAHNAGWAWWQWREASGYGIRSADGTTMDMATLRLLARPYLQAAPPGVTARVQGALHSALRIVVPAAAATETIVVAWPEYTLGTARVDSGGGCSTTTFDPGTSRLTVVVPPQHACAVDVVPALA